MNLNNHEKNHKKIKKMLFQYCAGLLSGRRVKRVEAHLENCSVCRAEAERIRLELTELKEISSFELEESVFAQCREEVMSGLTNPVSGLTIKPVSEPESGRSSKSGGGLAALWAWVSQPAVVAALVLIISFLIYGAAVIKAERLLAFNTPFSFFQPLTPS